MADKELVFYTNPMSRARIVRWMLEEIGASYRVENLSYGTTMKAPEYLSVNPMGKVPAIRHGDVVVTEAAAICAYLADVFPQAGLAPAPTDPARGPYYRWMFFAAGPVEQAATAKAMQFTVPAGKEGMLGYGTYGDVMNVLEQAVDGREFIAGDRFSAADVYVGSHLMWGMMFGSVEKRPAFERYCAGLGARPAHKRAGELDDALMTPEQRKMMASM